MARAVYEAFRERVHQNTLQRVLGSGGFIWPITAAGSEGQQGRPPGRVVIGENETVLVNRCLGKRPLRGLPNLLLLSPKKLGSQGGLQLSGPEI